MKKKSTVKWFFEFASMNKGQYIASIFFAILGVFCMILPYFVMGDIVANLLSGEKEFSIYLNKCLLMVVMWILRILFHSISTGLSHKATFGVLANIRRMLCDKLYRLPLGYVKDTSSGSLKNIIVERVDSMETGLAHVVPEFTANMLGPVIVIIYVFSIDWKMGLASLLTVPFGVLAYCGMFKGFSERFNNTIVKTKKLNDTAVEYICGIEVIKAFGKADSSYEKFVIAAKEGAACFVDWMRSCLFYSSASSTLLPATLTGMLPIGGMLYKAGNLSATNFILLIILSFGIIAPLMNASAHGEDIGKIGTIVSEVVSILEQEDMKRPEKIEKNIENTNIELKNVHFSYHEDEVLHGVNLHIDSGSVNAFVGPSGSGKSTIAKLIAGLWDANSGEILIGNINTKKMPIEYQNKIIAYVSQDNYLFDISVRENIRLAKPNASDEEVEDIAIKSGCHEFISSLENGYDTIVGGTGGHLSGGERQRISIARAMLKNADIIILDEATAYTDPENEALVQSAVAKLIKGKTLIVIAHRLSTIVDSDNIFVIEGGNIIANGKHDDLLKKCKLYSDMWESHISSKDSVGGEVNA